MTIDSSKNSPSCDPLGVQNEKLTQDTFQIELKNEIYCFYGTGIPEYPNINLSEQRREPTKIQPTYGFAAGTRTQATLVESECSHQCAILFTSSIT